MLRMKNFNILGIHWKINVEGGYCLKRGDWTVCWFKRGLGNKEGDGVSGGEGGGVETPMYTIILGLKRKIYFCYMLSFNYRTC